jgi:ClpP class serine protease
MTVQSFSGAWYIQESSLPGAFSLAQRGEDPFFYFTQRSMGFASLKDLPVSQQLAGDPNAFYDWYIKYYLLDDTTGIATITIAGGMSRFGFYGWGNEDYVKLIKRCDQSSNVRAIVLKMFTPGGTVDSTKMLAEAVRDTVKTILVHTALCCSAGLLVASQADEIWLEPQSATVIGSVGIVYIYINQAKAYQLQGLEPEIIRAPGSEDKYKPNSIEGLDELGRAYIDQGLVEGRNEFVGFMRRGLGHQITDEKLAFSGQVFNWKTGLKLGIAHNAGSIEQCYKRAIQLSKQS